MRFCVNSIGLKKVVERHKFSIDVSVIKKLKEIAEKNYPYEACGLILGEENKAFDIFQTENIFKERLNDRYEIHPRDFFNAQKYANEKNLDIIGIYHTHPEHPPFPSQFDLKNAWEDFYYLIISVYNKKFKDLKVWRFDKSNYFELQITT